MIKRVSFLKVFAGILFSAGLTLNAQIPQGFTYQALVKNQAGIIANTTLDVKLGILSDTLLNTYVYEEQQSARTNEDGLLTVIVGEGTRLQGQNFNTINWSATPLYLRVSILYQGAWKLMGNTRMWSIPFAMVSGKTDGINPGAKLVVESTDDASQDPLFEVKRKDGQTVFSVYPDAVNVFVPNGVKGTKGGFAIGGFDVAKGISQDYFRVTPDSIRAYINNNPTKGTKGGFAIGGFDEAKGLLPKFYMNVNGANVLDTVKGSPQVLWYPNKNAFLAGNVHIGSADSVGNYSTALGYRSLAVGNYSQAFGYRAVALGDYSTSIGKRSIAGARSGGVSTAANAFALGNNAKATGDDSYAFGSGAIASGFRSFAFGSVGLDENGNATTTPTTANQPYTFAAGMGAQATQRGAMALGIGAIASGYYSSSFGFYSTSSGYYSTALGFRSTASNQYAGALGYYANAGGYSSLALGYGSSASSSYATSVGASASATNSYASAFGRQAAAGGQNSVAVGYLASTGSSATDASSFGKSASATGASSIAIGVNASASGGTSVAIGTNSVSSSANSYAIGNGAQATGSSSYAIGLNSVASNTNSIAFGYEATASGNLGTAIGYKTKAIGTKTIAIGANYYKSSLIIINPIYPIIPILPIFPKGSDPLYDGTKGDEPADTKGYIILPTTINRDNQADGEYSIAIGAGNLVTGGGMAFGVYNDASNTYATTIGFGNAATSRYSLAAGFASQTDGDYSVAIGAYTTARAANSFVIGKYNYSTTSYSADSWIETDPLFVIGNGLNSSNASDAFRVRKNGNTEIMTRGAYAGLEIWHESPADATYSYGLLARINRAGTGYYYSGYFYNMGSGGTYRGLYADLRWGAAIDVAEYIYDSQGNTQPADVVVADPYTKESVVKSSEPYQTGVLGVISTKPHLTMGVELVMDEKGEDLKGVSATKLALTGRVPVNVCDENGSIQPGDYLTTSSQAGVAMKWTLLDVNAATDFEDLKRILSENERRRNTIIGKAVESFTGSGTGKVMMLISLQ